MAMATSAASSGQWARPSTSNSTPTKSVQEERTFQTRSFHVFILRKQLETRSQQIREMAKNAGPWKPEAKQGREAPG